MKRYKAIEAIKELPTEFDLDELSAKRIDYLNILACCKGFKNSVNPQE